jgi:DMSO/TMAO reductase YedYZ molybdopterin-dependent catalytic subunit
MRGTLPAGLPIIGRPTAGLIGGIAAAVALGVGELVAGLGGNGPSLVSAVGTEFIDRYAASLKDLAIKLFGTNDKVALIVGIVAVSLLFGVVLGILGRRRPVVAAAGFVGFGALGLYAYLGDELGRTSVGVLAAAASVAGGLGSLWLLLRLTPARPGAVVGHQPVPAASTDHPVPFDTAPADPSSRRTFITTAAVLAVTAGGTAVLGRRVRPTSAVETARRQTSLPKAGSSVAPPVRQPFEVQGLSTYITSTADFYRIDTAITTPQIAASSWQLDVKGMVGKPFSIGYEELLGLDNVEDVVTLQCVSNEVGGDLVGTAVWQGVPLGALLERARVDPAATQIVGRSADGWTAGFPTAHATDGRTALVVYAMNGEPLTAVHGFPARLLIAGLYGYVSATKWLTEIELTTWEDFDGYWVPRGWSKEGPIKTMSRIDVPRSGSAVTAGRLAIAGVAWAPNDGISAVEAQVDDGAWQECELGEASSGSTWVQWKLDWDATPGEHRIRARATNAAGETQTEDTADPAPNGATGWHTRLVQVGSP